MRTEQELVEEREHLAAARAGLRRMRERAEALFATGDGVAGDEIAAHALGTALSRRVAELADHPDIPLFFGKLTHTTGEAHHIGRRHVTDPAGEPLVIDWRAPVSRAFYQASAAEPLGVSVRRRFGYADGTLTSFEDEHLDRGEELGTASRILIDEIERPRVGPMRDIVATIQPEQDALVRAELDRTICVQGAPGTGKPVLGMRPTRYFRAPAWRYVTNVRQEAQCSAQLTGPGWLSIRAGVIVSDAPPLRPVPRARPIGARRPSSPSRVTTPS